MRRAVLRSGITLHYVERGRGRPIVLLHGGMGDLASWPSQLRELSRGYRVVAYSRRYSHPNRNGGAIPGYCAHDDAEDLAAFLDYLEIVQPCLVGTSYGAYVALALSLRHPGCVHRLVLAEPPVHRFAPPAQFRRFMADVWLPAARAFERRRPRDALRRLTDGMWGRPTFDGLPSSAVRIAERNAGAMRALAGSSDPFPRLRKDDLRRLRVPVLLLAGERTAPIHRTVNAALASLLPNVRQVTIAGASHGSPRENPAAFNRAVLEFLARHETPPSLPGNS